MKNNIKIIFAITVTSIAILVFVVVLRNAVFYSDPDEIALPASVEKSIDKNNVTISNTDTKDSTSSSVADAPIPTTYPKQLRIPSIKINAKVQYVGITKKGNMATPNNFTDVGWFKYGTLPGDTGSAVIAGHVDDGLALPGVFINLINVKVGDDIYIDTVGGDTIHFKVIGTQTYDFDATTEDIFNQNDGKYLKLITCTGEWLAQLKTHNQRLVVTAERVD